jgi:hypothetical protein
LFTSETEKEVRWETQDKEMGENAAGSERFKEFAFVKKKNI